MYKNNYVARLSSVNARNCTNAERQIWWDYSRSIDENLPYFVIHDQQLLKRQPGKTTLEEMLRTMEDYGINEFVILNDAGNMDDFYTILNNGWELMGDWTYEKNKIGFWSDCYIGYRFRKS